MSWLDRFRPYPELKTVIVNLKNNAAALQGVVWKRRGPFLVLRNVVLLGDQSKRLTGEVLVQLQDVEFIQVL